MWNFGQVARGPGTCTLDHVIRSETFSGFLAVSSHFKRFIIHAYAVQIASHAFTIERVVAAPREARQSRFFPRIVLQN